MLWFNLDHLRQLHVLGLGHLLLRCQYLCILIIDYNSPCKLLHPFCSVSHYDLNICSKVLKGLGPDFELHTPGLQGMINQSIGTGPSAATSLPLFPACTPHRLPHLWGTHWPTIKTTWLVDLADNARKCYGVARHACQPTVPRETSLAKWPGHMISIMTGPATAT